MIWVRYKGEIYILDFTFITDPTKSKIKYRGKNIVLKKWVRYKLEIYILHFTFITDPNNKFKEKFFMCFKIGFTIKWYLLYRLRVYNRHRKTLKFSFTNWFARML